MAECLFVVNAGSSSVKFSMYRLGRAGALELALRGMLEGLQTRPRFSARDGRGGLLEEKSWDAPLPFGQASEFLFDWSLSHLRRHRHRAVAIGHRVVHGGAQYTEPVRIDAEVVDRLRRLVPLAPLHQPHHIAVIQALLDRAPQLPQVACFDTAYHATQPWVAQEFGLPHEITDLGVRRYGFHGLSYEYIAWVLPQFDPRAAEGRVVVAHLGSGASMCAIRNGLSRASTMGFSAAEGLMMGTRSGTLDPGVILYLMDQYKMDARDIERLIYERSGLLGVSGISSDMRTLLASEDPRAKEAVDLFVYRVSRELGSLVAALKGLDAIVFTGGIGENSAVVRGRVCEDARWLGVDLDPESNARGGPHISRRGSAVSAWAIPTNEELVIARHTQRVLMQAPDSPVRLAQPA